MEEIKKRTEAISQLISLQGVNLYPAAAFESAYLQLRKICELIALACLLVHGDLPDARNKRLRKEWNADQILRQLERLHPAFYPIPGDQRLDPITGQVVEIMPVPSGFLTKKDLKALYAECGDYLHRGTVEGLSKLWEPEPDFGKISAWVKLIMRLLNHHQIQTSDPNVMLWVLMSSKEDHRVHSWTFTKQA